MNLIKLDLKQSHFFHNRAHNLVLVFLTLIILALYSITFKLVRPFSYTAIQHKYIFVGRLEMLFGFSQTKRLAKEYT